MCGTCDWSGAALLAEEILGDLPDWKTDLTAKVEDMSEWILKTHHVTDKMVSALEAISGGNRQMRKTRPPPTEEEKAEAVEAAGAKLQVQVGAMHVLLTPLKSATPRDLERTIVALTKQALSGGGAVKITNANSLNWASLRKTERDGAAAWIARNFDACAIVENHLGLLGRGVYDIAAAFLVAGKPVGVARDLSQGTVIVATGVETLNEADWKERYGRCTVDADEARAPLGSICSVCDEEQFDSASGVCCPNGHGGVPSKEDAEAHPSAAHRGDESEDW
jgi:hypothetical protein